MVSFLKNGLKVHALLVALLFVVPIGVYAQPIFDQAFQLPNFSVFAISGDQTIHTGYYVDPIDIDNDGAIDFENRGGSDIFIASYEADGTLQWMRTAGGEAPAYETPYGSKLPTDRAEAITIGHAGAIYVAGRFDTAADFDGDGIADIVADPQDTTGIFLARYNPNGDLKWVKSIENQRGSVSKLEYSPETKSLYLSGTWLDHIYAGSSIGYSFLIALNLDGSVLWHTRNEPLPGFDISLIESRDITLDNEGNIYQAGFFMGDVDFDGSGDIDPFSVPPGIFGRATAAYLAKYDANGILLWVRSTGEEGDDSAGVVKYHKDHIYLLGLYEGLVSFEGVNHTIKSEPSHNSFFLVKYSLDGNPEWGVFPSDLRPFGEWGGHTSDIKGLSMQFEKNDAILLAGNVWGIADFNHDGIGEIDTEVSVPYIVSYSEFGEYQWHWNLESSGAIKQLLTDDYNRFYVSANYSDSIDFDGPSELPALTLPADILFGEALARFTFPDPGLPVELTAFTATADGNAVTLQWQTASETNNAGFEVQVGADRDQPARWAAAAFIQGAGTTAEVQTYAHRIDPLEPGTYRFRLKQVDFDGTFAYSDEITLTIGLDDAYTLSEAFPNPFNPQATFSLSVAQAQQVRIDLYDLLGRRVQAIFDGTLPANGTQRFVIDGSSLPSGTYLYRVEGERFSASERVVLIK